jgi:hypothetical protein
MLEYIIDMNNIQKRFLLFLFGCIPLRLLLVYIAKNASINILQIMGYLALIPAFGFIYIYYSGSRPTGAEVFGDKIWWNYLRPIHALFYIMFALSAIYYKERTAYIWLLFDVILGLVSFLWFHFTNGDFNKLTN